MCRLGSHAVQLQDLEASRLKIRDRWRAQIEASEIEARMRRSSAIDGRAQGSGQVARSVEEYRAAAMRPDFDESHTLTGLRNAVGRIINSGQADRPGIAQHEVGDTAAAVADDLGKALLGDRNDLALGQSRPAAIKDSEFQDRKSTRLNSSHMSISYAVFCLK